MLIESDHSLFWPDRFGRKFNSQIDIDFGCACVRTVIGFVQRRAPLTGRNAGASASASATTRACARASACEIGYSSGRRRAQARVATKGASTAAYAAAVAGWGDHCARQAEHGK